MFFLFLIYFFNIINNFSNKIYQLEKNLTLLEEKFNLQIKNDQILKNHISFLNYQKNITKTKSQLFQYSSNLEIINSFYYLNNTLLNFFFSPKLQIFLNNTIYLKKINFKNLINKSCYPKNIEIQFFIKKNLVSSSFFNFFYNNKLNNNINFQIAIKIDEFFIIPYNFNSSNICIPNFKIKGFF